MFGTQFGQRMNFVPSNRTFHRMKASTNQIPLLIPRQNLKIPAQSANARLAVDLQMMKRLFYPQEKPTSHPFHVSTFPRSSSARYIHFPRKTLYRQSTNHLRLGVSRWRGAADRCSQDRQTQETAHVPPPIARTALWRSNSTPTNCRPPRESYRIRHDRRFAAVLSECGREDSRGWVAKCVWAFPSSTAGNMARTERRRRGRCRCVRFDMQRNGRWKCL